jgi:hypothetical protein
VGRHLSSRRHSSPSARLVPWLSPLRVSRFKVLLVQVREITHHLTVLSTTKGPSCSFCRNNTTRCSQVMSLDCLLFEGRVCFGRNLFPAGKVRFRTSHHVSRTTHEESTPRRAVSLTSRQVGGASFLIGPMILPRESDRGVLRPCLFSRMPVLARSSTGFAFLFPVNPAWFGRPSRAGDADRHPSRRVSCSTPSPVHATCCTIFGFVWTR